MEEENMDRAQFREQEERLSSPNPILVSEYDGQLHHLLQQASEDQEREGH